MKLSAVVLLAMTLAMVGCARQAPQAEAPQASSPAMAPIRVGVSSDPTIQVLGELYAQALVAKGHPASVVDADDDVSAQVSRLMADELDVVPGFAWSAAQELQINADDPRSLVSDLAVALDGEAAVLRPSKVDRAWRYVSTRTGASLLDLSATTTIVAPQRWRAAPDGPSGLAALYGAEPKVTIAADADERLAQARDGAIAVFDGTEPQGSDAAMKLVDDPKTMIASDPHVALLRLGVAEDETVLEVVQTLHDVLDNAAIVEIRTRAATNSVPAAVGEWLAAHPVR
ncbi:MAG: glycine betaine ABC transporter substrate-binding protein [Micropruina sp.]|uniref:glycine betaine ABC transporter substrate-binding protein n=1 Tax=Micropruina sp. TaxID=2737536 RepID=UPI0039E45BD1